MDDQSNPQYPTPGGPPGSAPVGPPPGGVPPPPPPPSPGPEPPPAGPPPVPEPPLGPTPGAPPAPPPPPSDGAGLKIFGWFVVILLVILLIGGGVYFAYLQGYLPFRKAPSETTTTTTTPPPSSTTEKPTTSANDARRKTDLKSIQQALDKYQTDNKQFPVSATLDKTNNASGALAKALVPKYIQKLPVDPQDPTFYYGYKSADGKTYELTAVLESSNDPDAVKSGTVNLYKLTGGK